MLSADQLAPERALCLARGDALGTAVGWHSAASPAPLSHPRRRTCARLTSRFCAGWRWTATGARLTLPPPPPCFHTCTSAFAHASHPASVPAGDGLPQARA
eukprot:364883-Chlamydomonas_euryale.AAC.3